MTYADRLNSFNTAVSQTQDHVSSIKNTLQNADLSANPVRTGLDMAGQVLGTADGLVRLRAGMKNDDVQRNVAKAIYNKLGSAQTGSLSSTTGQLTSQALGTRAAGTAATQSAGSYLADTGNHLTNSVKAVQRGGAPQIEAPVAQGVEAAAPVAAAAPATAAYVPPPQTTAPQFTDTGNLLEDSRDDMGVAQQQASTSQDALASARAFLSRRGASASATQDVGGIASTGEGASSTVAVPTSVNNGASLIPSSVSNALGDPDASIAERAGTLNLTPSIVPSQGGGLVSGLSTAGLASSDANAISRAQQFAGDTHELAQAAGSGVESVLGGARSFMSDAGGMLGDVGALAGGVSSLFGGGSAGAKNSDEQFQSTTQSIQGATGLAQAANKAGGAAKSGIQSALGVEEGLDVLAPDTGPLAPVLEAGSLLATLGTGIASMFEPEESSAPPPPKAPPPTSFAVGADLSNDASANVGAF